MADEGSVTELLGELAGGDAGVYDRVFALVYGQMRGLARAQLARERAGHTISPTVLVHEAYLKLVDQTSATFESRAHFLSVAALAMRRILINYAAARSAAKRGSGERMFTFDEESSGGGAASTAELLSIDRLLSRLAEAHERPARVVVYRLFGGLTDEEIAEVLGVSTPTVRRDWRFARAWLSRHMAPP